MSDIADEREAGPTLAASASASQGPGRARARIVRDVLVIAGLLSAITTLHLFTNTQAPNMVLHVLYRRLYYVPILYGAFIFGKRGGLLTAVAAAVPFGAHAGMSLGLLGAQVDNLMEIVMFFIIAGLFGHLRDMESRKTGALVEVSTQLENAYRKLEERAIQLINIQEYTQSILRSITSGVITVGSDASVTTANPAAERMLGMSEYDMVPRAVASLFRDDGGLSGEVTRVLSGSSTRALRETTVETHSGRTIHVQATASRMKAVGGRTLGCVVTLEDVSEVRSLTDQLIRADRLAAMGELTAGVAHEVRNPLGVIRASVQLLEESRVDPERIRQATDVIKQEIDRLDKVIKALLDFGRPSSPTLAPVDVEEVVRDVVLFTERFAKRANVRIESGLKGDLPRVRADADQLKQVLLNLVSNAVQAMEDRADDRPGAITIASNLVGGYVTLSVADDGPGIPLEALSKVFDPFYSTRADGTGLGLTIVHRIVDDHHGHIEVESGEDSGTRFTISLPAMDAEE